MDLSATRTTLNGICPYFTMFPLGFPLRILQKRSRRGDSVLDPFCGRGTTNFAARLLGLGSLGVDTSPVATAITSAKLATVGVSDIMSEARAILIQTEATDIPEAEFWEWAYHPDVLHRICQFRTALMRDCSSSARVALRGIILGALHGPRQKTFQSYLSNQSPRTYAPKPSYATRYWRRHDYRPAKVDMLDIVARRANRYYGSLPDGTGEVRLDDSRVPGSLTPGKNVPLFSWVITSPPYYGMRTYIPDQWLRHWFLGGPDRVDYTSEGQLLHSSSDEFVRDLRTVWDNAAQASAPDATMIVRFGGITARRADPLELAKASFRGSAWRLTTVKRAGSAREGKRQADAFLRKRTNPVVEFDLWAKLA